MSENIDAKNTLASTFSGIKNVYALGPIGGRVSFSSQQRRALNLVSALNQTKSIQPGSKVAVIGGGFGGVMAARALREFDCEVKLFVEEASLLSTIKVASHRFIHPNINYWPKAELQPTTNLPFFNWYEDTADQVCELILQQADQGELGKISYEAKVISVEQTPEKKIKVGIEHRTTLLSREFDLVVFADDFGVEELLEGFHSRSYWVPDALEHQSLEGKTKNFVISGHGDGAIIDALRLVYGSFDHGRLAVEVATKLSKTPISKIVLEGEAKAREVNSSSDLKAVYEEIAHMLSYEPEYKDLCKELESSIRFQNAVILSDPIMQSPFDYETAPIYKLLIAFAMRFAAIRYVKGELRRGNNNLVLLSNLNFNEKNTAFLIRRETRSKFNKFFPSKRQEQHFDVSNNIERFSQSPFLDYKNISHVLTELNDDKSRGEINDRLELAKSFAVNKFGASLTMDTEGFILEMGRHSNMDLIREHRIPKTLFGIPVKTYSPLSTNRDQRIFIIHSHHDSNIAKEIRDFLKMKNLGVRYEVWTDQNFKKASLDFQINLTSSDIILVLVSKGSLKSKWFSRELNSVEFFQNIHDRAIPLIPIVIDNAVLPVSLRDFSAINLKSDEKNALAKLVDRIAISTKIDFSNLTGNHFESLVFDLFSDLGFKRNSKGEFRFEDLDEFGSSRTTKWLTYVKHYKSKRIGVSVIREMYGRVLADPELGGVIMVTSGNLTSVSRATLEKVSSAKIRIVDRSELTKLILQRPILIRKYFKSADLVDAA